jgi:outer membrane protein OmpA-like peptidoglycan-associated protein
VVGTIKGGKDGKPIPDAVVAFGERLRSRVATDPDGGYQSGLLLPGSIEVVATAPGYEPAKGTAEVVAGSAATLDLALTPLVVSGNVRGRVTDREGNGLAATIRFVGTQIFEAQSDPAGAFSAALPAGPYRVMVEAPAKAGKEVPLDVVAGQDRQLEVSLRAPNPDVTLTAQAIVLRVPIKFRTGTPKLDAKARGQLDGVADILHEHPEIKTLRVEAHWSGPPTSQSAKKMTERQATAVKNHLVARGISPDRIDAVGFGGESPLVPNLGPRNQAKNRRLELVVVR